MTERGQGLTRQELLERLDALAPAIRFLGGHAVTRSDGEVDVSVDRPAGRRGPRGQLVTISAGFPPPEAVNGLDWVLRRVDGLGSERSGTTDRRGQFRLEDLEPVEYTLDFHMAEGVADSGSVAISFTPQDFAWAADEQRELLFFRAESTGLRVTLRFQGDSAVLTAVVAPPVPEDRLLRFILVDTAERRREGFLGLGGEGDGELALDLTWPMFGQAGLLWTRLDEIRPWTLDRLTPADRPALVLARAATQNDGGIDALDRAIRYLDATPDHS